MTNRVPQIVDVESDVEPSLADGWRKFLKEAQEDPFMQGSPFLLAVMLTLFLIVCVAGVAIWVAALVNLPLIGKLFTLAVPLTVAGLYVAIKQGGKQ